MSGVATENATGKTIVISVGPREMRLDFGGLVRWGRQGAELSMTELGKRIGVNAKTVQNWEIKGLRPRTDAMRRRLAAELFVEGSEEYRMIVEE